MYIIKMLSYIVTIITSIFTFIKVIVKYLKNKPNSKLKIFAKSSFISIILFSTVYFIPFFCFFSIFNFHINSRLIKNILMLIVAILAMILCPLLLVKEQYKTKNSFLIAEDYKLFDRDQKSFYQYSKNMSQIIANDFINNRLNNTVNLDKINIIRKNKHQLSKISHIYNALSLLTWFVLPLLALNLISLLSDDYKSKLDFVIVSTIITILLAIINCFIVYFDIRLKYGIVKQTDAMLKKHDKKYRKYLDTQKEKIK
ncbi:hypothetical protein [Staphylococcus epidermidis]|uniref:hypothetical protein n=1 Tax=Staphylococcus epidermidis TaxID=1282 RepID=UPI001E59F235|nr:hypothetical protein [Staphylococcus epidermidis]MCD8923053.1 hypothetical protein [Staphylococcus epidermidis]MCD9057881.1 hypothetical protein [Staphylococcus epidermidis]MEB5736404.1 hypothetical protein [Staphylococcus epidermidis]MEB7071800.1 hypothetical protein [Staphylococcus epidermidis]MEB7387607.1 hypothetical protein [Staphylococcus epidermidis]